MNISEKQRLIDLVFEIGMITRTNAEYFNKISVEEYAAWIADQLREHGIETTPRGISWGVLS